MNEEKLQMTPMIANGTTTNFTIAEVELHLRHLRPHSSTFTHHQGI